MRLYEIDEGIMACIDAETGEVIDPEKLEALQLEREKKLEGVALWIKNLKSDVNDLKAEKEAFAEREKQAKAKLESLSIWLTNALNGEKFETAKVKISFRNSEAVEITDESKIPEIYLRVKTVKEPNKPLLKEMLKNSFQIPGVALVQNKNIQIK